MAGPRGGTLIYSYIRRPGPFFWVIFNFNILEGFQKKIIFWGYDEIVDFFFLGGGGGRHKSGICLGVISIHFWAVS